jgi:hypothetical protein
LPNKSIRFLGSDVDILSAKELCRAAGLNVCVCKLNARKQPDVNWHFETANTSPENRRRLPDRITHAPAAARRLFRLEEEEGKIVWWWPMLTRIARKQCA